MNFQFIKQCFVENDEVMFKALEMGGFTFFSGHIHRSTIPIQIFLGIDALTLLLEIIV